jgi:ribosome-associated toxin RatA of RatAB toxin-antitoxin module
MAKVTKQIVVNAPIERFYELVADYERYPEFVPGIQACRILKDGPEKHVEYRLDLGVKRITYVLRMEERRPAHVAWSLVSGDMMKASNGSWELTPEDGRTRAVYTVDIQISRPPLVPQAIVDRVSDELTKIQLPRTLDAFKARAEGPKSKR